MNDRPGTLTLEEFCRQLAGNHRQIRNFAWWGRPDDDRRWGIWSLDHRDSGLIEQSNADAIRTELGRCFSARSVRIERHNHWAVGHVVALVIKVYTTRGSPTVAARKLHELLCRLGDYPLLDEDDYCQREYDATIENIQQVGGRMVKDDAPDDWPRQAFSWFWDHDQGAVENCDDQGGWPSEEQMTQCLVGLGLLDLEDVDWGGEQVLDALRLNPKLSIRDELAEELEIAAEWKQIQYIRSLVGMPRLSGFEEPN